MRHRDVAETVL